MQSALLCVVALLCLSQFTAAAESPEWQVYRQNLKALTAGNETVAESLGPLLSWEFSLPLEFIRRGQSYVGPNHRLRRVLADILAGKAVEVTVLGGSISTGAVASRKMDPKNPNDVWSIVRLFMQKNISNSIQFNNNARSATKSYITSMCLDRFLNDTASLVFVEFIANDGSEMDATISSSTKARSFERFLRRIMRKQAAPAVVLMQVSSCCIIMYQPVVRLLVVCTVMYRLRDSKHLTHACLTRPYVFVL